MTVPYTLRLAILTSQLKRRTGGILQFYKGLKKMRGLLYAEDYKPLFSGHETFALRQMWLTKGYEAATKAQAIDGEKRNIFSEESAIAVLGVGKNMVSSIRHWAVACDVLEETESGPQPTPFGKAIYSRNGLDPYTERAETLWLTHWKLAGGWSLAPGRTHRSASWYWAFNYIHEQSVSISGMQRSLMEYAKARGSRISDATLKRDIEVLLRCYAVRPDMSNVDDYADSMLSELGLLEQHARDEFRFRRGPKATLSDGAFLFALIDYWEGLAPSQSSLSFEIVAYEVGSPGRVFKLDENTVATKLMALESLTDGKYVWSDSGGIRQVTRRTKIDQKSALELAYA
jgi:hypothetical protein